MTNKTFAVLKARNYEFFQEDGTSRHVIVLYAGGKRAGFMEYGTARQFVDRIHDLVYVHEAAQRAAQHDS